MPPCAALLNVIHDLTRHAKFKRNSQRMTAVNPNGPSYRFVYTSCVAPLLNHVQNVVALRAEKEVFRVDACRHVAFVKHALSYRDHTEM